MIKAIQTERLTLRGWDVNDFEALANFLTDDELAKQRGGAVDRVAA